MSDVTSLRDVTTHLRIMLDNQWRHRTKGYVLRDMLPPDMLRHLEEEVAELRASLTTVAYATSLSAMAVGRIEARLELADILGVVLHLAIALDVGPDELCRLVVEKFKQRFESPPRQPPTASRSELVSALMADERLQAQRNTREHVVVSPALE